MLDTIKKMAAELLGLTLTEVRETREALHAEVAAEDGRYAARTQITHPEGSSTPLNKAAESTQQAFAKIRDQLEAELPAILRLILAYEVAEARRDEAAIARDKNWDIEIARRTSGTHPKVHDHFRRLFKHGTTPHTLGQHRDQEVAIMSDLHRWKAHDPRFTDPDNPWRQIYAIYANRLIGVPSSSNAVVRSVPGTPVRTKRYDPVKWYMFDEVAAKIGVLPTVAGASTPAPETTAAHTIMPQSALNLPGDNPAEDALPPLVSDDYDPGSCEAAVDANVIGAETEAAIGALELETSADAARPPEKSKEERIRELAVTIFDKDPIPLSIYWPEGIERGDHTPGVLIPALEAWVASPGGWGGARRFLDAARAGRSREFLDQKRREGIDHLAADLLAGSRDALDGAQRAGLLRDVLDALEPR